MSWRHAAGIPQGLCHGRALQRRSGSCDTVTGHGAGRVACALASEQAGPLGSRSAGLESLRVRSGPARWRSSAARTFGPEGPEAWLRCRAGVKRGRGRVAHLRPCHEGDSGARIVARAVLLSRCCYLGAAISVLLSRCCYLGAAISVLLSRCCYSARSRHAVHTSQVTGATVA